MRIRSVRLAASDPSRFASGRAISSAWLYPRSRWRSGVQRHRHDHVRAPFRRGARMTISASRAANQSPRRVTSSYFSSRIGLEKRIVVDREAARAIERVEIHAAQPAERLRSPAPPPRKTNGRPQQRHIGSAMRSKPSRQASQIGMRLAFVSVWPQIRHGAGKSTDASASSALLKITDSVANRRGYGRTLLQIGAAREEAERERRGERNRQTGA